MEISKKVSLSLLAVQVIFITIGSALLSRGIDNFVNDIEVEEAKKIQDRFLTGIQSQKTTLSDKVTDWSIWDDSFNFINNKNKEFVENNFGTAYLKAAKFNYVVFTDKNRRWIYSNSTQAPWEKWQEIPPSVIEPLRTIIENGNLELRSDISVIEGQLLSWAIAPVFDSKKEKSSNGFLFYGPKSGPDEFARVFRLLRSYL